MKLINVKNCYKVYKNGTTAIADLNVSIDKGEFVFVIGSTGSGKSTFIKMLYREEKPTKGDVIVGGINVAKLRNSKVHKLRRKLGVVFQDFKLLPKLTVYENVAFALEVLGMESKEIRPKVMKAIENVGLKEKIRNFPNQLSGGEQQRVAIARAFLKDAPIIILDEATSALDNKAEAIVQKAIENLMQDKTVFVIAHRLSTIQNANKIVVINQGEIVETGVHEQLLNNEHGAYKTLYNMQFKKQEITA